MHQSCDDLGCEACLDSPFLWCVTCQAKDLQVRSLPMESVYDFWAMAREIIFKAH